MTTYNIGANTGNTGSLVAYALQKGSPTGNQGGVSVYIGATNSSTLGRLVLLAGFGGLSGAGTVTNAKLRIANADGMSATVPFELRSLANTFVPAQVTWNNRATATAWNVAGALTGTDVNSTVIATGTAPTTGSNTLFDISGAGLNTWVQGCIDGSITVPALILSAVDDTTVFPATTQNRVRCDGGADGVRPVLIFDFVPATPPSASGADVLCTKHDGTTTITVTLSEAAPVGGCSVDYATQDSTAIAGQHYTGKTGTMVFAQGEQSKSEVLTVAP